MTFLVKDTHFHTISLTPATLSATTKKHSYRGKFVFLIEIAALLNLQFFPGT